MGQVFASLAQPPIVRVVYLELKSEIFVLAWPENYQQMVANLKQLFPSMQHDEITKLVFEDGTGRNVSVRTSAGFAGLVPKHRKVSPNVDCYYVLLQRWFRRAGQKPGVNK